jgi:dimethylamine/trimethylamine dehydrogenase
MHATGEAPAMFKRLHELGVRQVTSVTLQGIEPGRAVVEHHYDGRGPVELAADAIVLVTQRLSDDELYRALNANRKALDDAGIEGVYRIGDCVVPRLVVDAVFDGHRLAREIDSERPEVPLPYLREHRTLPSPLPGMAR